ncbi:hypothetical protein [Maribacter sp. 4G9]|uniref:hypothetical protein n=1 Tax=Maribacter sp. 4G9 TaxID=1889777 RepID=UPI000C1547DD|nr:hypothetical protein [Maribacter sp. 4G9]PIB28594.1 hypothetical protein BFP75_04945 [Maribacter sp. 4G9]
MISRFGIKITKYVFLGIMPFLLISNSDDKMDFVFGQPTNENLLPSQLDFGLAVEESDAGTLFNKWTLVFSDEEDQSKVELVMRVKNTGSELNEGAFEVHKVDGFLNGFEGIFGYFTHKDFGEKPFFADSGIVRIFRLDHKRIEGFMDVTLVNDYGRTIRISDSFRNY